MISRKTDTAFAGWEAETRTTPNNGAVPAIRHVEVTSSPLSVHALEAAVTDATVGATVTFNGIVRNHDHGREVTSLEYEGHPTAQRVLEDVAAELVERFEVTAIAVAHRIGSIQIGEAALVAVVAASHRGVAFDACAALVDLVKDRIPVWKHQTFTDGTSEWVNCA